MEDLHAMLKAKKIKCSMQALLDVLDDLVSFVIFMLFVCAVVSQYEFYVRFAYIL